LKKGSSFFSSLLAEENVCVGLRQSAVNLFSFLFLFRLPDEIKATKISSRLNRRAVPKSSHLTGQVGQAGQAGQADAHGFTRLNKI
jgi:hypothetical protein